MNKSPFRILKLKSGDDIIARLVGNKKDKIKLERPMYLKFMHYVDNSSGMRRETLVLVDQLKTTTANHIDIPRDHILGIFDPDPDIVKAYDMQKRFDDNPDVMRRTDENFKIDRKDDARPPNIDNILKIVAAKIDSMREQTEEASDNLEDMLEAMGMNFEDIEDDDTEVRLVKDDEKSPDYGQSFLDWSPNIEDYLT